MWLFQKNPCKFIQFSGIYYYLILWLNTKSSHPNVLRIVGISDESSESHFIQFHGSKWPSFCISQSEKMRLNKLVTSEQKMQWLIANALGTDLISSVQLSMKAVSKFSDNKYWIYLLYELQCQVKGIAVRFIFFQAIYAFNLCFRYVGRVELYQVPKNSGYVCRIHE